MPPPSPGAAADHETQQTSAPLTRADYISETRVLAAALDDRIDTMADFLTTVMERRWRDFVNGLYVDYSQAGGLDCTDANGTYYLFFVRQGVRFIGSYPSMGGWTKDDVTIPWDFIDPATSADYQAAHRARVESYITAVAADAHRTAELNAEERRAADEAEYERLRVLLGKAT